MAGNSNQTILTIGLELEMVVYHDPSPSEDDCINLQIAKHLRQGLAATFTSPSRSPYSAPATHVGAAKSMLVVASSPCLTPVVDWIGDHPKPRHFFVTSEPECARGLPDSHRAFAAGVEVRTPVLRLRSWQPAVEAVWNTLSAIPNVDIQFTQRCGLHVHIGRRGGFGLAHVKGLAKAVVIFEPDIERAWHPGHRRGVGPGLYADSNRGASVALKPLETTLEMLRLIGRQESVSGVRGVVCDVDVGHRDFKYNFQSLVELGSVEFRQAQGTLDAEWVAGWVAMLIKFVRAAEVVGEVLFERFAEAAENGEDRLKEFLEWGTDKGEEEEDDGYEEGEKRDGAWDGFGEQEEEEEEKRRRQFLQLVANLGTQRSQRLGDVGACFARLQSAQCRDQEVEWTGGFLPF